MMEGEKARKMRNAIRTLREEYASEGKAEAVVLTLAEAEELPAMSLARLFDLISETETEVKG